MAMSSWRAAETIAIVSLYAAGIVLMFSLGQRHYYGLPLVVLLYMLHWRWQRRAYRLDYPRSEQLVAIITSRRSTTRPDL
jgi:hypothetical protein